MDNLQSDNEPRLSNASKFGSQFKTAHTNNAGKNICKPHNDARGCRTPCPKGELHCCDIQLPTGKACGSTDHSRSGHRGPVVNL